ncbi:PAS domain-containing sensor histidine kinase [Fulvivirga lutea]|uniref:histidine kinase n=1 Tax=Fulvivirga lutea TaxID=2810512 RepID=A0A975A1H7_9BACT|nr:PAS domain-containing sensor histidine kinase [Fulvivirga lutea]QSE98260.1 PAS domain S-box protein [Fulvivirga lutea]
MTKPNLVKVEQLIASGNKLQAIRYLQNDLNMPLDEAVTTVESLDNEQNVNEKLKELNDQLLQQNKELAEKEKALQKSNDELIASQKEITQSKELITSINTNLSEGVYRSHAVGGLVYVNESFVRMFGYDSVEEMLNVPSRELYADPSSRKGLTSSIQKDKYRSNVEVLYKRKDGSTFWGLNSYYLTKDDNGDAVFDGAIRDITEEKKIQKKILESQRLLESINTNLSEGIYRSHKKGGLIYVNKAFAKMFGYDSPEEILAVKSINLYADPTSREEPIQTLREDHSRSNEETLFKRKDGSTFWGLNTYRLTTDEDGNEIYDGAVRDITDQKIYQEKLNKLNAELLKRNEELATQEKELEESNEALRSNSLSLVKTLEELSDRNFELDQLVYRTSHDLRSPLRSILGLVNLYKLEHEQVSDDYILKIEDRILKMDEFIKSMLNYSRASRMGLQYEKVNIKELIDDSIEGLEFLEGFQNMRINTKVTGELEKVITDKLRLKIVLGNILSNAIKYRNPELKENKLDITIKVLKKSVKITFVDNGIGISKEYLNKVFDMFYRATEQSDGSGLGMYIVKQSIERLEGQIDIESKLGVGTKITVTLPIAEENKPTD